VVPRNPLLTYYRKHISFWKKKIQELNIDLVLAHLQWANFIALRAGKKATVIPTRHHVDASFLFNSRKRKIEDAFINLLAKKQAVVSQRAKDFMLANEWFASKDNIHFIPLGYDFKLYENLKSGASEKIRNEHPAKMLLLLASRLITTKRHELMLRALKILNDKGLDIKLIALDDGPEKENLLKLTAELGLNSRVRFLGNQKNIPDYLIAADLVVHPSIEESSNQVLKEAAWFGKTAIVTRHIGDFDEFVEDKKNAFFIEQNHGPEQLAAIIEEIYLGKYDLNQMASELRKTVTLRFDIVNTIDQYLALAEK
jgi:glycosyltransferase involved in cell wall biosynthesis